MAAEIRTGDPSEVSLLEVSCTVFSTIGRLKALTNVSRPVLSWLSHPNVEEALVSRMCNITCLRHLSPR
jgi:hypothetical protein